MSNSEALPTTIFQTSSYVHMTAPCRPFGWITMSLETWYTLQMSIGLHTPRHNIVQYIH